VRRVLQIVGCCFVAACQTHPPLDLPAAVLGVAAAPDQRREADRQAAGAATARVTLVLLALRDVPEAPALDSAAIAIASDAGRPFRGASLLPPGSRWLGPDAVAALPAAPTAQQPRAVAMAVIGDGLLARILPAAGQPTGRSKEQFDAPSDEPSDEPSNEPLPELRLAATAGGGVQVFVVVRSDTGPSEEVRLAAPLLPGQTEALFVPVGSGHEFGIAGHALVLHHEGPASADAVAQARAALPPPPVAGPPPAWVLMTKAIGERARRSALCGALLGLAQAHQATRIVDLLLTADERALIAISQALSRGEPLPLTAEGAFAFERGSLRALLPAIERDELAPSLCACLRRHFGVVGGDAGALRNLLASSRDLPGFVAAVREENLATLGDRNPALRVAAHDWLAAHGGSVAGFEPLADVKERRRVLRAFVVAQATAVAGEATK
jgi:hypothetical protein